MRRRWGAMLSWEATERRAESEFAMDVTVGFSHRKFVTASCAASRPRSRRAAAGFVGRWQESLGGAQ